MIQNRLIRAILAKYSLPRHGIHGLPHWARVLENGTRLAPLTGADMQVVELFAVLHDCRRANEGEDPGHGMRAAELARSLPETVLDLDDSRLELLCFACANHTGGGTEGDPTVQTCWDADRLDLGRVGTTPDPRYLCTPAAKAPDMIRWADDRSRNGFVPPIVETWKNTKSTEELMVEDPFTG